MSHEIDTSGWKGFIVGELFDIHPTKAYKMTNAQLFDNGTNPVIVNSAFNNGMGGFTTLPCTEEGNIITFSDTTTADSIFYQADRFVGYPHVQGMYPRGKYADKWSANSMRFFVTVFHQTAIRNAIDYVSKFTRQFASSLNVKLPTTPSGDPDWNYMDEYMSSILKEEQEYADSLSDREFTKHEINTTTWKEFKVEDLFKITKPPVLHDKEVVPSSAGLPYVVRTKFNNGINDRVIPSKNVLPSPAGVITWGAENATFFYQPERFYSGRDIYYLDTRGLNANVCQYIAAVLSTIASKYPYNYGLFPELLKKEIIKFPVNAAGSPDWDYMDGYMSKIIDEENVLADQMKNRL